MTRQPLFIASGLGNKRFSASKMEKVKSRLSIEPYLTQPFQISVASEDSDSYGACTLLIKVRGLQLDYCPRSKPSCQIYTDNKRIIF